MSTNTVRKNGTRLGGLVAALALFGSISIGSASAAEAAGDCNRPNPHVNCSSEPQSEAEQAAMQNVVPCAVAAGAAGVGGPAAAAGTGGACLFSNLVNQ